MDQITTSLISDLIKALGISSEGESKDFEKFAIYSIVSNEYNKTFDVNSLVLGAGGDLGIDGMAIIVNGLLVESIDEIEDLLLYNGYLEVEYVIVQAKTSPSFNAAQIGNVIHGTLDFFSKNSGMARNSEIERLAKISNFLLENAARFRVNPKLKLYYVTTGRWTNDKNLNDRVAKGIVSLEETNLFSKVQFYAYGATELAFAYRKTKATITTTFTFQNRITIPKIKGISQAYIGLLRYTEFLKIISNEDDVLLNVFEDNVRDFQGADNDVNKGISLTLQGPDSEIFSVLNNGITIVASSISPTGDQFTITDYQIVNGCQTSSVLYNNRNALNIEDISIPIKLIATNDEEVKTKITLATNNQTPIRKEQLATLTEFQRRLELFYNSFSGENRIYYERRSKQYNSDPNVQKSRIITVPYQIKSFVAMFLEEPHNVTSYFGLIISKLNADKIDIFKKDHMLLPYYVSALSYYKLESLFKKGYIDTKYKKVRFHILMVFRILNYPGKSLQLPPLNSRQIENDCKQLLDILNDDNRVLNAFFNAILVINDSGFNLEDKQELKLVAKTKLLIDYFSKS